MLKAEILLPLYYNPDNNGKRKEIEGNRYAETYDELLEQFGGVTKDNSSLLGGWVDPRTGTRIDDENITFWIICNENDENIEFLNQYKDALKERFKQEDIMIYYVKIERL